MKAHKKAKAICILHMTWIPQVIKNGSSEIWLHVHVDKCQLYSRGATSNIEPSLNHSY